MGEAGGREERPVFEDTDYRKSRPLILLERGTSEGCHYEHFVRLLMGSTLPKCPFLGQGGAAAMPGFKSPVSCGVGGYEGQAGCILASCTFRGRKSSRS